MDYTLSVMCKYENVSVHYKLYVEYFSSSLLL